MNKNTSFASMFIYSTSNFKRVFDLFEAKLGKVLLYFLLLNFIIFIPVTYSVVTMDNIDYGRYGMTFHEDVPEWFTELPPSCKIANSELDCGIEYVWEYQIENRDTTYDVYLNVSNMEDYEYENSIIFGQEEFHVRLSGEIVLRFTYRNFPPTNFADFEGLTKEEISTELFDGMFASIMPTLSLPIIIFFVGGLMGMNFLLMLFISALSMLFSFNQNDFPSYANMIKLMIFASTIPSLINLVLGFFGLAAFTSISYNIITPIIAYFMYIQSRIYNEIV